MVGQGFKNKTLLSLLLGQSQDLIFHFQKHEWSDHSLEMETILQTARCVPHSLTCRAGKPPMGWASVSQPRNDCGFSWHPRSPVQFWILHRCHCDCMAIPTRYRTLWRLRKKDGSEGQLKVYGETVRIVRETERQGRERARETMEGGRLTTTYAECPMTNTAFTLGHIFYLKE